MLAPLVAIRGADRDAEHRARRVLERLGAIDLTCVHEVALPTDCDADYIVRIDGDRHSLCAFTAAAVRELRALGLEVAIDADYPFHVVEKDVGWFADVGPDAERPDWFGLELGVEVDGKRVDLLPLVLEMLDDVDEAEGLRALERRFRASYALPVSDTHHVTVSSERLRALVRVVIELYQGVPLAKGLANGRITFPASRAAALGSVDAALAKTGAKIAWTDPTGVVARARAIASEPPPVAAPPTLRASLRPYQEAGVAFLQHLRETEMGGVLADDMGFRQDAPDDRARLRREGRGPPHAPRAHRRPDEPRRKLGARAREVRAAPPRRRLPRPEAQGAPHSDGCVRRLITTYPVVAIDEERLAEREFHLLVLDEAQAIKNARSQAHRAIQ